MSDRALIHRSLDGEALDADERRRLERLLRSDPEARALHEMQAALRRLPTERFPDTALQQVLRRTSRRRRLHAAGWAAAALLLLAIGLPALRELTVPPTPEYSAEEIAEAERQLAQVFGFTSETIGRSTLGETLEVFRDEVSPALRRLPLIGTGDGS